MNAADIAGTMMASACLTLATSTAVSAAAPKTITAFEFPHF
jgi:hypothetical protein